MPEKVLVLIAKNRLLTLTLIVLSSALPTLAFAELLYNGQNRLSFDYYNVTGDKSNGLYQFENGQAYNDFSLYFSDNYSAYRSMRGYVLANTNNSDYRGDYGTKVSNASFSYENGESNTPYRLEVGDYFASQSRRILQRGLKGLQIELQPQNSTIPQSIQLFIGRSAQDYRTLFEDDTDYYLGASWLTEDEKYGALAATSVNYHSTKNAGNNIENVSSIMWTNDFKSSHFTHTIEAEIAYLSGKNATTNSLNGYSQFLKFSGYGSSGQNYLVNLERNDEQFSPVGAAVTADRETIDLQWGQRFFDTMNIRIRSQRYQDKYTTANATTSRINGINVSGVPFSTVSNLFKNTNVSFDLYKQNNRDENRTFDRDNRSLQLNISSPINEQLRSRLSYQWFKADNIVANTDSTRQSISAGMDYIFDKYNWRGTISPTLRYTEDIDVFQNATSNTSLGWLINASKNGHRLLFSYSFVEYRADDPLTIESNTAQTRLEWKKDWKQHSVSAGLDHFNRDPDNNRTTDSYKVAFSWTFRFEKPTTQYQSTSPTSISPTILSFTRLDDLSLGAIFDDTTIQALKNAGYSFLGNSGKYKLYTGQLFPIIDNQQIIAVETVAGSINAASILIPTSHDPMQTEQLYQRVLDEMLTLYGTPSLTIERGEFSTDWIDQLQTNKFSRFVEWPTATGIIRMGIPRPKTGQIRIEIQHRRLQPSVDDNDWGLPVVL